MLLPFGTRGPHREWCWLLLLPFHLWPWFDAPPTPTLNVALSVSCLQRRGVAHPCPPHLEPPCLKWGGGGRAIQFVNHILIWPGGLEVNY